AASPFPPLFFLPFPFLPSCFVVFSLLKYRPFCSLALSSASIPRSLSLFLPSSSLPALVISVYTSPILLLRQVQSIPISSSATRSVLASPDTRHSDLFLKSKSKSCEHKHEHEYYRSAFP